MTKVYPDAMTPDEFFQARKTLGWGMGLMGRALKLGRWYDPEDIGPKTRVRSMENGRREISGPVSVAVGAFLAGYRPDHLEWYGEQDDD